MNSVDPANASELANIAREVGAQVLEGNLRYRSGSWHLGDVDLCEHLDSYRDQRLMVIFVPLGNAKAEPVICGVCGFVMNEVGECPRCKLAVEDAAREVERERKELFEDIEAFLEGEAPEE